MKSSLCILATFIAGATSILAGPPDAKDMKGMAPSMMNESDAGFYIAAFGGANVAQGYGNGHTEFDPSGGRFTYDTSSSNHVGGVGGLKGGYNFQSMPLGNDFRLQFATELEAYYVGTKTVTHGNFGSNDDFSLHGNQNNGAFMLNSLVRLKNASKFTPYIGIGVGTEYITFTKPTLTDVEDPAGDPVQHNANTFAGAVQAIGGLDFEIAKHWDIFTEYKYLVAIYPDLDFGNTHFGRGENFNLKFNPDDFGQHLVTAGVKYSF